mgnify:CR=1 FL=1
MKNNKIIDINKKSFINILIMLFSLIVVAIVITYIVPKGTFGTKINEYGEIITDYSNFIKLPDKSGINILKGLFGFILVLFSGDGLSLIMLSLFLLVISGTFQVMSDTSGMKVIVNRLIRKFKDKKYTLVSLLTLVFMAFGTFFGLFEEVLTLLPLIVMITISLGYDGYLGFLICIVGCGFGFASGLTNPFTVITASNIIGADPMSNIWFRVLVFILMYGLLLLFIFSHIKKLERDPKSSPTYDTDQNKLEIVSEEEIENEPRIFKTYLILLLLILALIITVTSIEALRGYTVVFLTAVFLFCGIVAGLIVFVVAIIIYAIILVLEFFISSSTAKSIFVMGILSFVNVKLSKEMLVLIYLFGDGFTNVLLPTSPVLLIGLSMVGLNYFTWLKKSKFLFLLNTILVIGLICLAVWIGY